MTQTVPAAAPAALRIYRRHHLVGPNGITGLSPASLYRAIAAGSFPRPVPLSARAVGWPSDVVEQWITTRSAGGIA
ncbi:MAG: AlpA family phage regulatory protein [Hydrogenophaga sp.]|nr:AlpA family phage regulatory protein [Hydrogenophaga sp.]